MNSIVPGRLNGLNSVPQAVASVEQQLAHENLYRDASTLVYGDDKPSEDAIDRVVGKINREYVLMLLLILTLSHTLSVSKSVESFHGGASTRQRGISLILMKRTACSTRR